MIAKRILHIEYDYDFLLIGICSHEKDYRLCWEINKMLDIGLERGDNITLNTSDGELMTFSLYFCNCSETNNYFHLLSNKSSNGVLITEQKKVDYFLKIKGNISPEYMGVLIKKLRKIPIVLTAYQIDPVKIKSIQKLLF